MTAPRDGSSSALGNQPFRRYWVGHTISSFGDQISALGFPLIAATTLNASAGQIGVLTAAIWTPTLMSLFIGTWADQQAHPRRVLVAANAIQAVAVAAVPVAWALDALSFAVLLAAALALGTGGAVFDTSYTRFFVRFVPREQYISANSMLSTTNSMSGIAGPAVGGAIIQALTAPVAMIIDAFSFMASAAVIWSVDDTGRTEPEPESVKDGGYFRRLRAGSAYLAGNALLRASLACCAVMNLAAFMVQALLILYATRTLDLNPGEIGLAFGVGGLGGLAGAALAGVVARRYGIGRTIAVGAVLYTVPFCALPLASPGIQGLAVLAIVEGVSSLGIILFDINNNSMRAAVTRDAMRSRVAGAYATVNYGMRPVGALVGGLLGTYIGVSTTLLIAGFGGIIGMALLFASPVLRVKDLSDL